MLDEKERRRQAAPWATYQPWPKHATLHDQPYEKRILALLGANKSGKTWWGTAQSLAHSIGYYFWKVPGNVVGDDGLPLPRERIPPRYWVRDGLGIPIRVPNDGMVVTGLSRERGIGQVIWPCFESFFPPQYFAPPNKPTRGSQGVVTVWRPPWGGMVIFASAEQDELSFEGTRIQWAWGDEPVRPFVFNGLWRGLAVDNGRVWFTLTPLGTKAAWMYRKWIRTSPHNAAWVRVLQRDNKALSEEAIREFERTGEWTDAERRARLEGEFENLGGRVIHNFDKSVHIVPARVLPKSWKHGLAVDPHHVRPAACLWFKVDPATNAYHFFREWPNDPDKPFVTMKSGGLTPAEYARLFREIETNDQPSFRIVDPRFGKSEQTHQGQIMTSWVEQMGAAGMQFDARVPNTARIEYGEQLIVEMLRFNKSFPIGPTNSPRIFIHDCCVNTIDALENYGILEQRDPTKGEPEKRSEEFKDFIDCLRYAVLYPLPADSDATLDLYGDAAWEEENYGESWQ